MALSCALVCAGFMKSLGVYGTGSLGRITASLCVKVCAVRRCVAFLIGDLVFEPGLCFKLCLPVRQL
jgi:hypothetical protein